MEVYLIRHTQVGIESGICYGQTDVPLADSFPLECKRVQEKLPNSDRITVSIGSAIKVTRCCEGIDQTCKDGLNRCEGESDLCDRLYKVK